MIEQEIISKDLNGTCWKTETIDNRKIRSPATEQEFIEYKKRRTELLDELTQEYKDANAELSVLAASENRHFESSENRHFQFN